MAKNIPPPIPGTPTDVLVATTAAANTMGVPPAVAASVIAAGKAGDKDARRQMAAAGKVYAAAQRGDKGAQAQIAAVTRDAKSGHAPAAQKAAFLAAAVGSKKGVRNYQDRKAKQPPPKKGPPLVLASVAPAPRRSIFQFGSSVYQPYAISLHTHREKI